MGIRSEIIVLMLKRAAGGYGLLLAMAAGGLAFANVFGFVGAAFQFGEEASHDATATRTWMHVGWVFGVCIALLGSVMRKRKKTSKNEASEAHEKTDLDQVQDEASTEGRRHGLLASAAWGGFFGTVLGSMLGVTFILLWFSIAYSPFAPSGWASSVSVKRQRVAASRQEDRVAITDHPVAIFAFGLPVAIGAVAGAAFGGIARATDAE